MSLENKQFREVAQDRRTRDWRRNQLSRGSSRMQVSNPALPTIQIERAETRLKAVR